MVERKAYRSSTEERFQRFKGKFIIPILGDSGAGKSSFINLLLGAEVVEVGDSLEPCTRDLQAIDVPFDQIAQYLPQWCSTHADRQLVIVDTPGLGGTVANDLAILRRIADWLGKSYSAGAKLAGIIYLHEVFASRFTGSIQRNIKGFEKLCGRRNYVSVVLGTTKWGLVHPDELGKMELRQDELRQVYWAEMASRGSTVQRVDATTLSAWKLVETVLNQSELDWRDDTKKRTDSLSVQSLHRVAEWVRNLIKMSLSRTSD